MMESRNSYGYFASKQANINRKLKKYLVCYKSKFGGVGTLGYLGLFDTVKDALAAYNREAATNSFMVEPVIRHPRPLELTDRY